MAPPESPSGNKKNPQRRSQRLLLRVAVIATRQPEGPKSKPEETETLAVNAHGALILLAPPVEEGEQFLIKNVRTEEEQLSKVVYLGLTEGGRLQVGIEFTSPAPEFWRVVFPPEDWGSPKEPRPAPKT